MARHNQQVTTTDGKKVWVNRAIVIAVIVLYKLGREYYILLDKRGAHNHAAPSMWCIPAGFLDWDESVLEGALREVKEETGVNLLDIDKHWMGRKTTPWKVVSQPNANSSQNVVLYYVCQGEGNKLPAVTKEYAEPDEVDDVRWFPLMDAAFMNLAFGHEKRIRAAIRYLRLSLEDGKYMDIDEMDEDEE